MVALGGATTNAERVIGFVAVLLGAMNTAGGYSVTERMLEMFKSGKDQRPAGGGSGGAGSTGDAA